MVHSRVDNHTLMVSHLLTVNGLALLSVYWSDTNFYLKRLEQENYSNQDRDFPARLARYGKIFLQEQSYDIHGTSLEQFENKYNLSLVVWAYFNYLSVLLSGR